MTVSELITALQAMPGDAVVYVEAESGDLARQGVIGVRVASMADRDWPFEPPWGEGAGVIVSADIE